MQEKSSPPTREMCVSILWEVGEIQNNYNNANDNNHDHHQYYSNYNNYSQKRTITISIKYWINHKNEHNTYIMCKNILSIIWYFIQQI